ncbi:MAG: phage tail protein [Blastocatellia bacterium]|nr:MAG: phage tail protein [Blastocatellia bacterium]
MPEPTLGEIKMFAGNFAPAGWMLCQGQTLPISENETLFLLIGTTYGGDGVETFNLPNLASRVPIHMGTGPDGTSYQLGEAAGTEQETLTVQQIPNHTHSFQASTSPGTQNAPANNVVASSPSVTLFVQDVTDSSLAASAVTAVGGSQPHENTQPFLCVNFIISLFGVYPQS